MQSWSERSQRRGGGVTPVRPPILWMAKDAWHELAERDGTLRVMLWRPGIECWIGRDGRRVNAEEAPHQGLAYLRPHEPAP